MSIWSDRLTEAGAFWGMAAGFVVNVGMNALALMGSVAWPVIADPILVAALSSYCVMVFVSRQGEVSTTEREYRIALHRLPEQEKDPAVVRQTLLWPACDGIRWLRVERITDDFLCPALWTSG